MNVQDSANMNEALQNWVNEKQKNVKDKELKNTEVEKNKPKCKCELCGEKTAVSTCIKCGKSVCKACHFKLIGVCKKCVPSEVAGKWEGSVPDWEKELGVEWVG